MRGAAVLGLLVATALPLAARAQSAVGAYPSGNGAVSLPVLPGASAPAATTAAATTNASPAVSGGGSGGGGSGGRAGVGSSSGAATVSGATGRGGSSGARGGVSDWVLCPPTGAPGAEPFLSGTALSCAP